VLTDVTVVDLTSPLGPATVLWPGEQPLAAVESFDPTAGATSRRVTLPEHCGTHLDAPVHYVREGTDVAGIPVSRLVGPLVVIDVAVACTADRDHVLAVDEVRAHEAQHGAIAAGSVVCLRTGWDRHLADADAYRGGTSEDTLSFPGFGVDAARLLVAERAVVGLGIDSLGIDAGRAVGAPVHTQVSLPAGVWHVENLTGLDQVPATGATVVVGVPKVAGATGFPARVIALVPATAR
jgi:kynurenine formamidase